jgi:hypothetical protein
MSTFTEKEIEYLRGQRLGRLATVVVSLGIEGHALSAAGRASARSVRGG